MDLEALRLIIKNKIKAKDSNSYSYKLFSDGINKISQKVGEEAVETVIAALDYQANKENKKLKEDLVNEVCDLLYHLLVLLEKSEIELSEIYSILELRNSQKNLGSK